MTDQMKILQAIGGAGHGGAENFFVMLTEAFQQAGLQQHVVTRSHPVRDQRLQEAGVSMEHLKFGGRLDFQSPRKLQKIANEFGPDIFLSWMGRASSMAPKGDFQRVARVGGYYKLKYFEKCDHIVGITPHLCDYMVELGWPRERTHYIPNFIRWSPEPAVSRTEFDTPEGAPLILCLGRLHPVKGLDTAIKALKDVPDAYLWIAGDGPLKSELESLTDDLNLKSRVRFLGWRTDKEALLATANFVLFPSRQEGFGNVILESWASKTPMIATRAEGPSQFIKHGENGLLADIDNTEQISALLNQVISDHKLNNSLKNKGFEDYSRDFTEKACIRNWKGFFEKICSPA
ncbi:MAG: glycosyltransferase [Sneathiella sp.]|nr:glycosyltransferase [Sneathiella sp.]